MLDATIVGVKIASLRKQHGLSQEKLAEMLDISPQAISKWENGHTLPDATLLPVLAQIFTCTIDELIMPAYSSNMGIEQEKPTLIEQQAQQIAKYVIQQLDSKYRPEQIVGLDDDTIINAVLQSNPNLSGCIVTRGKPETNPRYTSLHVTVTTPQRVIKLIEKIYSSNDRELYGCSLFRQHTLLLPHIYHIDVQQKVVLMEDLNDEYLQGIQFDENNKSGKMYREHYKNLLQGVANLHLVFWENEITFEQICLDWRHDTEDNLLAHISSMEKDFLMYKKNEEAGTIPKVWEVFENTIEIEKLEYFHTAIKLLREQYVELVRTRFHTGKHITIIHGDLHPGQTFLSNYGKKTVKIVDYQAYRMGLCTEDLAMLLALHIAPERDKAQPLLDYYYRCLCGVVHDYPYEMFINDYKLAIMENMFFPIRLINRGIFDFSMRDRAIKAFETFVLGNE